MKSKRIMKSIALVMAAAVVSLTAGSVITEAATTNVEKTTQIANRADVKYGKIKKADKAMLKEMFNAEYYSLLNPDVVEMYGNDADALFNHFIECGIFEGRTPNSNFNVAAYASAYPDLQNKFGGDIVKYYKHYQETGREEGRNLTTVSACSKAGISVYSMNSISSSGVVSDATPIMTPATYNQVVAAVENAGIPSGAADSIVSIISKMPALPSGMGSSGNSGPILSTYTITILNASSDDFSISIQTNSVGDLVANSVRVYKNDVLSQSGILLGSIEGASLTCGGETLPITISNVSSGDADVPIHIVIRNDDIVLGIQTGIMNPSAP